MSKLPANFEQNLQLIKTLRSLPLSCHAGQCGYTCTEIFDQHNVLFPSTPLTLDQVCSLLRKGVATGVYIFGGCLTGAVTAQTCNAQTITSENSTDFQLYYINTSMASVNPANLAYVAVGYAADPTQPRTGYLPCTAFYCGSGGGKVADPYSRNGSSLFCGNGSNFSGKAEAVGSFPAAGSGCPAFLECGTCNE